MGDLINKHIRKPKLKNRFLVNFKKDLSDIESHIITSTARPKYSSGGWGFMEINIEDNISGTPTNKILFNCLEKSNYKVEYELILIDEKGEIIENWLIKGLIDELDFGNLVYDLSDPCNIRLKIKPTEIKLLK